MKIIKDIILTIWSLSFVFLLISFSNSVSAQTNAKGERIFNSIQEVNQQDQTHCKGFVSLPVQVRDPKTGAYTSVNKCFAVDWNQGGIFGWGKICKVDNNSTEVDRSLCQSSSQPPAAAPQPAVQTQTQQANKTGVVVACPSNRNARPDPELYDCSNGQACYNDFVYDFFTDDNQTICYKDPATPNFHCDNGNTSFLGKGTVSQNCTGTGTGWVGNSGCGDRNNPSNKALDEYDCSRGLRCFNDYFRDESTECRWQSKVNVTGEYAGQTYHCVPDPKCGNPTDKPTGDANKVIRDQFLKDYIQTASEICGIKKGLCEIKVQACITKLNNDANNGNLLDECVRNVYEEVEKETAITEGALSILRSGRQTLLPVTSESETTIQLFISDRTGAVSNVFAPGQKVDISAKLFNPVLGENQNGCVPGEEITIFIGPGKLADKDNSTQIANIPTCYRFQNYALPNTPGDYTLLTDYHGNDRIRAGIGETLFTITDKPSVQTTTFAHINGTEHTTVSPDDGIYFAGKTVVGDSINNECIVDELAMTLYKAGGGGGQNTEIWSKPRAVNCTQYVLNDEIGRDLESGAYILHVEYKGNQRLLASSADAFITVTQRQSIPVNLTLTGQVQGVSTKAKSDQKLSLAKIFKNVAGISATQQGETIIVTNDPQSNSQGIVITPCATPEQGSSSDISLISVIANRINDDGSVTPAIADASYPNCTGSTLPINDLGELDRIEVTASFIPPAGSPYLPASADLDIEADENEPPVEENFSLELTSFPDASDVTPSDEVRLIAYTNKPVDNPVFTISREGNEYTMEAQNSVNDCQDGVGICLYEATLYNPNGDEKVEFCAQGVCKHLQFAYQGQGQEEYGEITGVDLLLEGQAIPLSLEGEEIELFLGENPETVAQLVIHLEGLPDKRRTVRFIYEPSPTPEDCPNWQFLENECTDCGVARSIEQDSCSGDTRISQEGVSDEGCLGSDWCEQTNCSWNFLRNECTGCNEARSVEVNSCSGETRISEEGVYDSDCESWCQTNDCITSCGINNGQNCSDQNKADTECAEYYNDSSTCSFTDEGPRRDGCIP